MVSIDYVKFGEVKVDGNVYYSDMIVWWDGDKEFVPKSHMLDMKTFSIMLRKNPDMVVFGTGLQCMVSISDEVRCLAKDRGIKVFEEESTKAVDIFNAMIASGKNVVAYIHTTC
jgi:hypothetical protein